MRFSTIALAIFCLLYGFAHVTNITIVWMDPLTGLSALAAGVLLLLGSRVP